MISSLVLVLAWAFSIHYINPRLLNYKIQDFSQTVWGNQLTEHKQFQSMQPLLLFMSLFIYSLIWSLSFFKTQVTKETEKLETRIEIEENKSNSIKQVTVSNEYLHLFHSVFPVSKKVKILLLCIRVKDVHLKDFFRRKQSSLFSEGSTPQQDSANREIA